MELFQIAMDYCGTLKPIILILDAVLTVIKIGIPIILILMGTIDLGKAVLSSDDKAIKESTSRLVKRVIAAVAIFFVTTIVELIMGIVAENADKEADSWSSCWKTVKEGKSGDNNTNDEK